MNAPIFKAWNLNNFKVGLVDTQANECLNFEAITVNLYIIKAIPPKGVVTVA